MKMSDTMSFSVWVSDPQSYQICAGGQGKAAMPELGRPLHMHDSSEDESGYPASACPAYGDCIRVANEPTDRGKVDDPSENRTLSAVQPASDGQPCSE
jgi:hypothetical protein